MRNDLNDVINKVLSKKSLEIGVELMIDDDFKRENSEYIIYSYNSREFLEKGNISQALAGNNSLLIDKTNLDVYQLNSFEIDGIDLKKMIKKELVTLMPRE